VADHASRLGNGGTVSGPLHERAEEYLRLRNRLGYELINPGRLVRTFADYCDAAGIGCVTVQVALDWAMLPQGGTAWYHYRRLGAVRGFATYLNALDPAHQIPPADLLSCRYVRRAPRILTSTEIDALLSAAAALRDARRGKRPALRGATYQTIIALMAVTGIRPCEVLRINDADLASDVLTVHGKNHKDRKIPLHTTTLAALADYVRLRDQTFPGYAGPSLFVTIHAGRPSYCQLRDVFAELVDASGLAPDEPTGGSAGPAEAGGRRPTLGSLRHSFAVSTLIGWLVSGTDVNINLPALSTWMGHSAPQFTYWYLQAVPELLQAAAGHMVDIAAVTPLDPLPRRTPWRRMPS
jgi:integrase